MQSDCLLLYAAIKGTPYARFAKHLALLLLLPRVPQVGCHDECVSVSGLNHVMCFSWRSDNQGPAQDTLEVAAVMRTVRQQWPGATVQASTLDAFVDQLAEAVDQGKVQLPVVTGEVYCNMLAVRSQVVMLSDACNKMS